MTKTAALLTFAALGLTALGSGGWAAWNSTSAAHGEPQPGSSVAIEVVPPREPELRPGPILPVGELRDEYRHDPDQLRGPSPMDLPVESAWLEWYEPLPEFPSIIVSVPMDPAPSRRRTPDMDRHDYSFGFDAPKPDYAAERDTRQSALARSAPVVSDSAFY